MEKNTNTDHIKDTTSTNNSQDNKSNQQEQSKTIVDHPTLEDESLPPNRFELELEFIQCLASPAYLHNLATSGLLSDPAFLSFLQYLTYWKTPEYVRFIAYPHALHFLDLILTNERFRREIANVPFRNFVHEQQYYAWQHRYSHLYGTGLQDPKKNDQNPLQPQQETVNQESNENKMDVNGSEAVGS